MSFKSNLPWIEKYRPNCLDDVIDEGNKITILKGLIEKDELPHLLFYGPPGTGKTSLILACARDYFGENFRKYVLELNASDDRGIDTVRKQIPEFIKTSTNKIKLIILDEADALTNDAQGALRRVIEQYSKYCRFCLICNNIYKIIGGLRSRCVIIRFGKLPINNMKTKLDTIIKAENVKINDRAIDLMLRHCGDFRQILNVLQLKHTLKRTLENSDDYTQIDNEDICNYFGIPTDERFNSIVESLLNNRLKDNVNMLIDHHNNNYYSLVELIRLLTIWISDHKKLTIGNKRKLIEGISDIDFRLKNSMGDSDIQIYCLASLFLGLKKEIK